MKNVTKTYRTTHGEVVALEDVNLTIDDGEWVAVKGPTGGGKSTLLQLLGALDRPTTGSVELSDERDTVLLETLPEHRLAAVRARRIGFVFQSFNLIPTLTAVDNVAAALRPLGVRGAAARQRAMDALESVGLADRCDHLPGMLSGGQQQRVAVARALVKEPEVLLADEPTGNLDERMRDEIVALLRTIRELRPVTLIMVTHDSHVAGCADRIVQLARGRVLQYA